MRRKILQLILAILIILGFFWLYKIIFPGTPKIEKNPFSSNNISSQTFIIKSSNDTVIKSQSGSLLIFRKNSFVNNNGKLINGQIVIEFKELLDKTDIIFSGLTTTTNGKILESGGVIFIKALSNGQTVELSDSGKIGFAIQTDSILPGMQIFNGELQQDNIDWVTPSHLLNDTIIRIAEAKPWHQDEITREEALELGFITIDTLTGDRIFEDIESVFPEIDTSNMEEVNNPIDFFDMSGNSNAFSEDINQKYVFELFNLGWANIDRLLDDERTEFVDLTTSISNYHEFGQVYITMVFTSKNIYLPGYQKIDMTFSFTHGDYEETRLPIGEDALIIATSSKNGVPYIDIKHITIIKKQKIQLSLKESSKGKLRNMIEENL